MLVLLLSILFLLALPFQGRVPEGWVGFDVFATPSIVINSVPDIITAGTTFPVTFTITEASSSASYYYKFFGGVDTDVYKITNSPDLSYSSSWSNFPQITLNPSDSNIFNSFAYVKSDVATGTLNLKIRISDTNTKSGVTSPTFPIEVVSAPPPTEVPTPTLTSTPTPTKTPTSTPTLIPTKISTPTKIPTSSPTPEISSLYQGEMPEGQRGFDPKSEISNTSAPEILGTNTTNKKTYFPLIFICLGGIFLLTPLIIAKLKHENKKNN